MSDKDQATLIPTGYDEFLSEIKQRIQSAQVRAALAVSRELTLLYWQIGQGLTTRQENSGWGEGAIAPPRDRPSDVVPRH